MKRITQLIPKRLIFSRELRGLTIMDIAKAMNMSRQAVSNWENGRRSPNVLIIKRLSTVLGVPYTFLITDQPAMIQGDLTLFRSKVAVPKRTKISYDHILQIYGFIVSQLSELVKLPDFALQGIISADSSFKILDQDYIEFMARSVRRHFGIQNGPIANVTALLERAGIYVVFINEPGSGINALTKEINGRFMVLLNIANQSAVRIRFSLAHELGHILLHSQYQLSSYNNKEIHKRLEVEANIFAGCLLMPKEGFLLDVTKPTLGGLVTLKTHWKVAIQAMAVRLKQLNIIDVQQETQIFKEISRNYSRKNEPYDFGPNSIPIEYPTLINSALKYLENHNVEYTSKFQKYGYSLSFLEQTFPYLMFSKVNCEKLKSEPKLHLI